MIGIIGAGQIVESAHIPAYLANGLKVSRIYDVDQKRCQLVANAVGATVAKSVDEILQDPQVELVDVAVIPDATPDLVEKALRAGKNVFAQKPLAPTPQRARELVQLAAKLKRRLIVNQQMRYIPMIVNLRAMIADGRLGPLSLLQFYIDMPLPRNMPDGWITRYPRPVIFLNTIHPLDTARSLMGEPETVRCWTAHDTKNLHLKGETEAIIRLDWANGARMEIVDRRNGFGDPHASYRAEGAGGAVRGTIGMWTNYPVGVDDTAEYTSAFGEPRWTPVPLVGRWMPHGFIGIVKDLADGLKTGRTLPTEGSDNIKTIELVDACYRSAEQNGVTIKVGA